ncbi:hypothetical protein DPMN_140610 [Dreissena polymorpha]|uniref:Uncharacterized protein n=1 Tax=Dreissena polymorpha TaxID=45954 RepID=A0A9D4GB64_DREPO|nr:hypothetical protein DPMN_140610 [Dreissena polymorpha]
MFMYCLPPTTHGSVADSAKRCCLVKVRQWRPTLQKANVSPAEERSVSGLTRLRNTRTRDS